MTTTLRSRAPLSFRRESDWAAWLARNHGKATEVWVKIAKKKSGEKTVNHDEAVEVALCWGWIDGQGRGLDESWWLQRFTPRTRRSPWSRINRERALALIKTGRMKKPGLAEVERAKQDGRWEKAYAGQRQSTVPRRGSCGEQARSGVLQDPRFEEPLRRAPSHPKRQESRDPRAAHRDLRRHAGSWREDPSLSARPATSTPSGRSSA